MRNLLITGLPRSGTTLLASLINSVKDAFVLQEPYWQNKMAVEATDPNALAEAIVEDYFKCRRVLQENGTLQDRVGLDGKSVTNYVCRNALGKMGKNYQVVQRAAPGFSDQSIFGVKHNAMFTAILPSVLEYSGIDCIVIVRNPAAILCSWNGCDFPISEGRLPQAEKVWPELRGITLSSATVLEKQCLIYKLFLEQYLAVSEGIVLFHYEDLINDASTLSDYFNSAINTEMIQKQAFTKNRLNATYEFEEQFKKIAGAAYDKFLKTFPRVSRSGRSDI